jgi:MATE family multidrug resistance protein
MLRLAVPVILAELGWMAMGIVDTMCVGRLSAEAIGAVGLGHALFFPFVMVGHGLLLGLDTLVSQAVGAGKPEEARRALVQGIFLALGLSVPLMAGVELLARNIAWFGLDPAVAPMAAEYLRVDNLSLPILLVYTAIRRYLQALGLVRALVFALATANLLNLAANYGLIFGEWGMPRLGLMGSAWATVGARGWMLLVMAAALAVYERRTGRGLRGLGWRYDRRFFRGLIALGLPAAVQILLEVGVFSLATLAAGRLDASSLAAHQIALQIASATFMVPLGFSAATAVRVGHAVGRRDPAGAARSGWVGLALGAASMLAATTVMVGAPGPIMRGFTDQAPVVAAGAALLGLAAVFQLFDGIQVVATGALRGAGDTRTPMLANLAAHWALGLPVAWFLAFRAGLGVRGIWIGLSLGLIAVGIALLITWARLCRRSLGVAAGADPAGRLEGSAAAG